MAERFSMTTNLILTVIGDDSPGLVESVAHIVAENSGNWLESSMSQLAGKFAGILRVTVADQNADKLISELENVPSGLKVVVERATPGEESKPLKVATLTLVGNDRPGIIRDISRSFASFSVNVEELSTECVPAPMTSEVLFKAKAILKIPAALELDVLQDDLEHLADDLIVELNLE